MCELVTHLFLTHFLQVWYEALPVFLVNLTDSPCSLPLLGVDGTSLIAISTPLDETNFFSVLLQLRKPNGQPLFLNLQIELVCAKCLESGETTCPHNANNAPEWKTAARTDLVKSLMGDSAMWLREQAGVITRKDNAAYDRPCLDKMLHIRDALI